MHPAYKESKVTRRARDAFCKQQEISLRALKLFIMISIHVSLLFGLLDAQFEQLNIL